jgi:transposase
MLLRDIDPDRIRHRLYEFHDAAANAHMDETTRLATTVETWWPAILVALTEDITDARTEGFSRPSVSDAA